jgi:hypothetical protein
VHFKDQVPGVAVKAAIIYKEIRILKRKGE